MPKCIICEKDFVIRPSGKQGGANRQICYDCLPEDIGSHQERNKATKFLISQKLEKEKVNRDGEDPGSTSGRSSNRRLV